MESHYNGLKISFYKTDIVILKTPRMQNIEFCPGKYLISLQKDQKNVNFKTENL
jgi:hypothetical protein